VVSGRIVAALVQAATMLLLARSVTPAEFGFFSGPYGVATLAQTAFDLGLPTLAVRTRSTDRTSGLVARALAVNNRFSTLLATVLLVITVVLGVTVNVRYLVFAPLAVWAAAERNADAWLGVALADGDVWVNMVNLVLRRVFSLLLFVALLGSHSVDPILAFGASVALAACGSSLFAHSFVGRRLAPGSKQPIRWLLRAAWPFWLNSVATQARNLDVTLTTIAAGATQAGFYAAASRLTGPLRLLSTSLASVLLPTAARRGAEGIRSLLRLVLLVTIGSAVAFGVGILVVPTLVPVLLGDAYRGSVPALQVICVGLVFASATALLDSILQGVGLEHYVAGTAVGTTLLSLACVVAGALSSGAVGAATGLSFSYLLQCVLLWARLVSHDRRSQRAVEG
jgi:O-antigen/teichoic acid export membrane protein